MKNKDKVRGIEKENLEKIKIFLQKLAQEKKEKETKKDGNN